MEAKTMNTTCQIPESVRNIFSADSTVDEYASFLRRPTRHLLGADSQECIEAVQGLVTQAAESVGGNRAYRFVIEAQLDAIDEVVESLERQHPERFRDTERVRDLVENLDILLNGGVSA